MYSIIDIKSASFSPICSPFRAIAFSRSLLRVITSISLVCWFKTVTLTGVKSASISNHERDAAHSSVRCFLFFASDDQNSVLEYALPWVDSDFVPFKVLVRKPVVDFGEISLVLTIF